MLEGFLANRDRCDEPLRSSLTDDGLLDVHDQLINYLRVYHSLVGADSDATLQLPDIERFVTAVTFLNHQCLLFHLLIACEAGTAVKAFTPSSDGSAIGTRPGLHYSIVIASTFRTFHNKPSFLRVSLKPKKIYI